MDKQQFDHIENRIREAADEISIPFSGEAWKKMELKLDNEFSKDRGRRGIIWWWFPIVLLGFGALGVYVYNSGSPVKSNKTSNNSSPSAIQTNAGRETDSAIIALTGESTKSLHVVKGKVGQGNIEPQVSGKVHSNLVTPGSNNKVAIKSPRQQSGNRFSPSSEIKSTNITEKNNVSGSIFVPHYTSTNVKLTNKSTNNYINKTSRHFEKLTENYHNNNQAGKIKNSYTYDNSPSSNNSSVLLKLALDSLPIVVSKINIKFPDPVIKDNSLTNPDIAVSKRTPIKLDAASARGFYFLASAAMDATGIKSISIDGTKPMYGVGTGYQFNKRLSLQTGFYFGKKVYSAGADDYKIKPGSYIAKIISAEAECYIYDIPLTLRYDVIHKKMSNLYFTTGLSSYILKRETYDMHFFNPSGSYRRMSYTYTHNVNYFSVLNLSLGYEHKFSNTMSVQAEPYLKLPLAGVGEGSVKLYSAGLQVGVKYQPLRKKK